MKHASSCILATLMLGPLGAAEPWVNFIRQHQLETGVVWDMPVTNQGSGPSALGVSEDGALFQLWTIRTSDSKDFLLDQKLAGAYLPQAEIEIETLDPYPLLHRTRADQPFTVNITVSGLLGGPNIPEAAKQVLVEHHLASYTDERVPLPLAQTLGGQPHTTGVITRNGRTSLEFAFSSLPSSDPTEACGEEHFVIHALPDGDVPQTQIAGSHVQVWPVAKARIEGIQPGQTIRFSTPDLHLTYDDLYPSSFTYLHVYPGSPKLGKSGSKVEGSKRTLDQDSSMDLFLNIENWSDAIQADGLHTMEIVTETPFGRERLAYLSFNVDRELAVNASLNSLETNAR